MSSLEQTMKLYLISQDENQDYDTYGSAVVCALDEDSARMMAPNGENGEQFNFATRYSQWCSSPDKVVVKFIGDAAPDLPVGVVCASFNAG